MQKKRLEDHIAILLTLEICLEEPLFLFSDMSLFTRQVILQGITQDPERTPDPTMETYLRTTLYRELW